MRAIRLRRVLAVGVAALALAPAVADVADVAPRDGAWGTRLRVTGDGFGKVRPRVMLIPVDFGGRPRTTRLRVLPGWSETEVECEIRRAAAGTYRLDVRPKSSEALAGPEVVVHLPRVDVVEPAILAPRGALSIEGDHFGTKRGSVRVGGRRTRVLEWTPRRIDVRLPAKLGVGPLSIDVRSPAGTSTARDVARRADPQAQGVALAQALTTLGASVATGADRAAAMDEAASTLRASGLFEGVGIGEDGTTFVLHNGSGGFDVLVDTSAAEDESRAARPGKQPDEACDPAGRSGDATELTLRAAAGAGKAVYFLPFAHDVPKSVPPAATRSLLAAAGYQVVEWRDGDCTLARLIAVMEDPATRLLLIASHGGIGTPCPSAAPCTGSPRTFFVLGENFRAGIRTGLSAQQAGGVHRYLNMKGVLGSVNAFLDSRESRVCVDSTFIASLRRPGLLVWCNACNSLTRGDLARAFVDSAGATTFVGWTDYLVPSIGAEAFARFVKGASYPGSSHEGALLGTRHDGELVRSRTPYPLFGIRGLPFWPTSHVEDLAHYPEPAATPAYLVPPRTPADSLGHQLPLYLQAEIEDPTQPPVVGLFGAIVSGADGGPVTGIAGVYEEVGDETLLLQTRPITWGARRGVDFVFRFRGFPSVDDEVTVSCRAADAVVNTPEFCEYFDCRFAFKWSEGLSWYATNGAGDVVSSGHVNVLPALWDD